MAEENEEESEDALKRIVEILEEDQPGPKKSPIKAILRKVKASPPQYLSRAIEELKKHEAYAQSVVLRAEQNLQAVDDLVDKKEDQVAGRVFRGNIYAAVLAVAAIVALSIYASVDEPTPEAPPTQASK